MKNKASNFHFLHQINYIKLLHILFILYTEYKKSSLNNNKISRTLNNQTNYRKNYLDLPKASAWSPCSDDSAYFELSMSHFSKEPVSLLTPVHTPVTSPGPSFCTALEQLADLAIKRIEKTR